MPALPRGDVEGARRAARAAADAGPRDALVLDREGRMLGFRALEVSLLRRANLRRIVVALVEQAERAPGVALTRDQLLAAAWPGERMRTDSGAFRVYTSIRRLRALGLGHALVTRDDGYLIDPAVRIVRT